MRKAWFSLMSMFIFLSMLSMLSIPTIADLITTVNADVDQDEVAVDVSPGSTGSTTVTGVVTVDNLNSATPLVVSLQTESTTGSSVISPPSMVFQGGKTSDSFQVIVNVPLGTTASEDHTGTVFGTWVQGGRSGGVEGDTFKIIILPYFYPNLSCKSPMRNVTRGESVTFEMLLNNSGNVDDVFHVEVKNREELEGKGIKINDIDDMSIAEKGFEEFELRVRTSDDSPIDKISIHLVATSTIGEEPVPDTYTIVVNIREKGLSIEVIFNPLVLILIVVVIIVVIIVYMKKR